MVRPKKYLGQHFLKNREIAKDIVEALTGHMQYDTLVEVGPGTGILTGFLLEKSTKLVLVEIDRDSVDYLKKNYDLEKGQLLNVDFLQLDLKAVDNSGMGIIGNFPYNISSQLFFKIIENHTLVREVVCMVQDEVARRISSAKGHKTYGILSVFLQAYYDIEYLFQVPPEVFFPPPKVNSGVIRLKRNNVVELPCNTKLFKSVVKQGFQNRRKTLRNALKPLNLPAGLNEHVFMSKRAEQLGPEEFIELTNIIEELWNK
ncbi:MAG: 16S rRNA (adenine(1518)-N(6)/adenine(1519)-N(6))-dimethyltransferase RsmA [Cyclobacteriaceae bacterium]|nr:16S rRNA (adenine(1518)-N(6)/adenine(1519)-N(6))-dimethyltransferase RsmA [Cyclobacteriaceae bacterium]